MKLDGLFVFFFIIVLLSCGSDSQNDQFEEYETLEGVYYDPCTGRKYLSIEKDTSEFGYYIELLFAGDEKERLRFKGHYYPYNKEGKNKLDKEGLKFMLGGSDYQEDLLGYLIVGRDEAVVLHTVPGYESRSHIFETGLALFNPLFEQNQMSSFLSLRINLHRLE